ncbi:MAG TPA: RNA 2',3'-cyclic phosphodiesterase [Solirubrobacteraceae bacterium]|nr:RNA 2',3'-cyclic phosphodiesterase [Solirubrobacteraceae bacterium]
MSEPPARLFVALELGAESRIASAQWAAGLGRPELRPVAAGALHVTLCFLGDVAVGEVPAIVDALASSPLGAVGPRDVARVRWLPPRRPRVLALELSDPDNALRDLQAAVAGALEPGGWYRAGRRRYLPHLTVARVRAPVERTRAGVPALAVRPEAVALLRSHLGGGSARYERLAIWPIR